MTYEHRNPSESEMTELVAGAVHRRAVIAGAAKCTVGSLLISALAVAPAQSADGVAAPASPVGLGQVQLDPKAALIIVDPMRVGLDQTMTPSFSEVLSRASALAAAFRDRGMPVFITRVTGTVHSPRREPSGPRKARSADAFELAPGMEPHPGDHLVIKPSWSAFVGTTLDYDLRRLGVTQVFVTGVSTTVGVESTVRSAFDLGYNVVPVIDAMSDPDADANRHTIEKIFPRLSQRATTKDVLALVAARS